MKFFAPIALAAAVCAAPLSAEELSREEIKKLVYEAILENPQIVMDAVALLREQEQQQQAAAAETVLAERGDEIRDVSNAPFRGNPEGDIVIVEFFDYNCGYCKRAFSAVEQLLTEDAGVKLVYREWPILSEGSVYAAKASLAARDQDMYDAFHMELMKLPRANEQTVLRAAEKVGLDVEKLMADMESDAVKEHLDATRSMTEALGFSGTPSFVIGDTLVPGFVPMEQLVEIIAEERKAKEEG